MYGCTYSGEHNMYLFGRCYMAVFFYFLMAYIPPHKRQARDGDGSSAPTPQLLVPLSNRRLNSNASRTNKRRDGKIIYAHNCLSRLLAVGLDDDNQFPPTARLKPISLDYLERKLGEKPVILDLEHGPIPEIRERPWHCIAENILQDLLFCFENVRTEIDAMDPDQLVKPTFVARFGKILFHGGPSVSIETIGRNLAGNKLEQLKKTFYSNISSAYAEKIIAEEVPEIGLEFEGEKDLYHVKLSDASRPETTISCKCSVRVEEKRLQLNKIELNQVRHMVIDILCLHKNLDLRLMLNTKKILVGLADDELQWLRDVIDSAIIDPNMKGGLRWPLGKSSHGERFCVVGVWHTKAKAYVNSSMRLKVRHANRFDFRTSNGESAWEVALKLKGIVSELEAHKGDVKLMVKMLEEKLTLLFSHFLNCDRFLD